MPGNLTFVPLDLEHHTLAEDLAAAGFDASRPAFFGWLGVIPYLPLETFRATLGTIARLPAGSGVSFDYAVAPETLSAVGRTAFDALAGRVAAAGEPFPALLYAGGVGAGAAHARDFSASSSWITDSSTNSTSRIAPTG